MRSEKTLAKGEPMKYFPDLTKPSNKKTLEQDHRKNMIKLGLDWFSKEMEIELIKHLDRLGWKKANFNFLFKRLCDEVIELEKALFAKDCGIKRKNQKQIIKECADVANFAMMIADNIKK